MDTGVHQSGADTHSGGKHTRTGRGYATRGESNTTIKQETVNTELKTQENMTLT